jgi:phosphohistidine phosphatase
MKLLVIRHAIAEDREVFAETGRDDALRPLTAEGSRKMRRAARGLRQIVPTIDELVASPFTRASETAEIVRREYEIDRVETADVLRPDTGLDDVMNWLSQRTSDVVAIVGHEPHLSRLATYLVAGVDNSAVQLKKGGACLVSFDGAPRPASGCLMWSVPPGLLRDLAG